MSFLFWVVVILGGITALAYQKVRVATWTTIALVVMVLLTAFSGLGFISLLLLWAITLAIFIPLNFKQIRYEYVIPRILKTYRAMQPAMSQTEQQAIDAGDVDWDGELFSGKPDWDKFLADKTIDLNEAEQAFIDGPVTELCTMIDNWDITHNKADLPDAMWQFLKDQGFFGLIIPEEYGGKGFSAIAHTAVLVKVAGRSSTVATTISVPNSLGPAELLLHYGSEPQKKYYLPRLANGEEIPCFALTGPDAGSDASAMTDTGIVCRGEYNGEEIIGIKLNWNKRYITLAPIATVLGLAFKLYDPDGLIGDNKDIGITCALIPTHIDGITIGRRHYPLNICFQNGPTQGKDVFIPLDFIIGGVEQAGCGWRMLVECLSAGRAITLPSIGIATSKAAVASTGAYARIRKQFSLPIGYFEGVEEVIARMAGCTYMASALTRITVDRVTKGKKPSVTSAIAKYHATEIARRVMNDAMDIHGGKGICMGPNNYLGRGYQGIPIGITVEGANILTRSMIIFGQGAIRCHPYVLQEMMAANLEDEQQAIKAFDKAFMGHMAHIINCKARSFVLGLTNGRLSYAPPKQTQRYYQQLTRFSAVLSMLTDVCMINLGAKLKRKESLSGRLGDLLSYLYIGSTVLKRFEEQGAHKEDLPLVEWACQYVLLQCQTAVDEILQNFPKRWLGYLLRFTIFPFGRRIKGPSDFLNHRVARLMLSNTETRARLIEGIDLTESSYNAFAKLQQTLEQVVEAEPLEKKIHQQLKLDGAATLDYASRLEQALSQGIINKEEQQQLSQMNQLRSEIIAVDDFDPSELQRGE